MDLKPSGDPAAGSLDEQIGAWRAHLRRSRAVAAPDAEELEDHLREQIASLGAHGLSEDEAFLVAVKRMGAIDALTREFAREHSDRLWKQLVLSGEAGDGAAAAPEAGASRKMWAALGLAVAAGAAVKAPELFGVSLDGDELFYVRNLAFFVLPFIAVYFAWERPLPRAGRLGLAAAFAGAAALVNAFPFAPQSHTALLTAIHLPIVLWLGVGVAYTAGQWVGSERRMDFIRFTGEAFIYYVLIGLGGGVFIAMTLALFQAIGIDLESVVGAWIAPCGAAGAAIVAAWLVEAKQSVIENMAPVLTWIFAPLFALALLAFLGAMLWTGRGIDVAREVLIAFDLLLVVVFALLLYSASARDPLARPGLLDWVQLTLVGAALAVDALALWAVGARISDFGFTPNRMAALGLNVALLVNLGGAAYLYARFVQGRAALLRLWRWQMFYLYVLAAWAAIVAFLFPIVFGFA